MRYIGNVILPKESVLQNIKEENPLKYDLKIRQSKMTVNNIDKDLVNCIYFKHSKLRDMCLNRETLKIVNE